MTTMSNEVFLTGITDKYQKELLETRTVTEGNVVSCFMKDLTLLEDTKLSTDSFVTKDGLFYFSMLKKLREKGFNSIDEVTILSNLSENVIDRYNELGGYDTIRHLQSVINTDNFNIYLDELYKQNIILHMADDGFNLLKETISPKGKKIVPLKLFQRMTSVQVLDWYESKLAGYQISESSKVTGEGEINFSDEFLKSVAEGVENGISFEYGGLDVNGDQINCFPFLSRQVMGVKEGTSTVIAGYSSTGKSTWNVTLLFSLLTQGRKILIISNEEKQNDFEIRFLNLIVYKYLRYYKLTKRKLMTGSLTEEDKAAIQKARAWWNENYGHQLFFVSVSEMDMSVNKKLIRQYILRKGVDTVLIDTLKVDFNDRREERVDLDLVQDSRELDAIAKKYNIVMISSLQLAMNSKGILFLTSNQISNAKQIVEVLSLLIMMRNVYKEELDPDNKRFYCEPFRKENKDGKWVEVPYTVDPTGIYRMVFFSKTRFGSNSEDDGVAMLYRYYGDQCRFVEVAFCRPKHDQIM